ncbi:5'-deoxyadenosine deaminase [Clostridium omnivorum]|uniref:5-methylthioadenosine/S-adenosylhomocysteine deaminase n=1 Tax=Clostridium omnivorum TaxID=1604902 RepID=A0ABQ5N0Q2_9CLOT|nr:5'-deoxyadenosine deaminase [Clostridium sp. E14]GLC28784.1 5-methylthioadenosine/S-adenosylhomocysteine deaminase [Clostridium sp. E14]
MKILIKNALILTMDEKFSKFKGYIAITDTRIEKISKSEIEGAFDKVIDADGKIAMPGFVQPHIHLCQTLFRGTADDMELLDWLKYRIWPLEGAHDEESIYYSAMLGISELIKGGTTSIVDMETVHYTDNAIKAIYDSGLRAITGKVMMDYGTEVPASLMERKEDSIAESVKLLKKWHKADDGRIEYAFTPRFVVSCSEELLLEVSKLSKEYGVKVHTHASENRGEIAFVQQDRNMRNINYLKKVGLLNENLILAHCIWLNDEEVELISKSNAKVVHCPSSNLKLSSGIAKIPELLERGVNVGIASDGAPCSNNLDAFMEMKLSSLIQKVTIGPKAMDCKQVLYLATMGGAKVMGKEKEIGSIEEGKKADIIILDLNKVHNAPSFNENEESQIVFSGKTENVITTIINGKVVMEDRKLLNFDEENIIKMCNRSIEKVWNRAKISINI